MKKLNVSNKTKKRILSVLLIIAVLVGSFTGDFFREESHADNTKSKTAIQIGTEENPLNLTIPIIDNTGPTKTKTNSIMWLTVKDGNGYKTAYCLAHGHHFRSNLDLTELDNVLDDLGYSTNEKITLAYLLYYGYNKEGCETDTEVYNGATINTSTKASVEYMATQTLIWVLGVDVKHNTSYFRKGQFNTTKFEDCLTKMSNIIPNNKITVNSTSVYARDYFISYAKELANKVYQVQYKMQPSFAIKTGKSGIKTAVSNSQKSPIKLTWNKSKNAYVATVTDTSLTALSHYVKSGKFNQTAFYNINATTISNPGYSFKFSKTTSANDTLTITASKPISGTTGICATANKEWVCDKSDTANASVTWSFQKEGYQPVAAGELKTDPVYMTFALSTPETTATINLNKTDKVTGKSIQGVEFTLYEYDKSATKYVKTNTTATTDANGKSSFKVKINSSNMGKFRVYETSSPEAYYLSVNKCVFNADNKTQLVPGDVVNQGVDNPPYQANVTVIKQGKYLDKLDSNGNFKYSTEHIKLSGAKVGIFTDSKATKPVTKDYAGNAISYTATTDAEGLARWKGLKPGIYYLKEIAAPAGYNVSSQIVKVDASLESDKKSDTSATIWNSGWITDPPSTFVFSVVKRDSENGQTVEGIQFTLYSKATMYNKNGEKIVAANTAIKKLYTDTNGKVNFTDLPAYAYNYKGELVSWKSNFYVKETGRKSGTEGAKYIINTTTNYVYNGGTVNISNPPIKGTVTVLKTGNTLSAFAGVNKGFKFDTKMNLAGVKFDIIALEDIKDAQGTLKHKKNSVVTTITTDSKGQATATNLYPGKYGAKEKSTGADYILDTKTYTFTLTTSSDKPAATVSVNNLLHELRIGVLKKDKDTLQPVPNTEFGIYAAENIKNAAGTVIVKKDVLVATGVSDANGYVTIPNLAKAKYYAKELKAAPGFNLDTTKITLNAPYKKDAVVYKEVYNKQITASLEVYKTGKELTSFDNGEFTFNTDKPLEGVVFSLYAKNEIKDALGNHVYDKDEKVATGTTDAKGKILFENLTQGVYILREEYVPEGHLISKESYEVNLTTKDSSKLTFTVNQSVSNDYDYGEVVVTKKDQDTLEALADCKLGLYAAEDIKNADGKVIVKKDQLITSALSDADGKINFDKLPHASYYVKEIEPCDGYKLSSVKLPTGEIFIEPVDLEYLNDKMDAKLTVYKTGDEISSIAGNNMAFNFDAQIPLAGVEFNLYAAEDIYDALSVKQFEAGDTVATLVTDKEGKAVNTNLYPGKYKLIETVTNEDYFLDTTEYLVDLTYSDGTSVPQQIVNISNTHKKYFINLVKANDYTGEGLKGSTYGIFANEDIKNKAGEIIAPKNTLVAKGVTDEDGKIIFKNLDEAEFYIKELSAPPGFNISPVEYPVTKDQLTLIEEEIADEFPVYDSNVDGSGTIEAVDGGVNVTVTDVPIEVEFDKIDVVTGSLLPGCKLEIYTADGKLYDSFTTTDESYKISAMPAGQYVLKEVSTIDGYTLAADLKFTVKQEGGVQKVTLVNERVLFNFEVEKLDELTKEPLKGAEFEIKNSAGEVVDTIVTNNKGIATSKDLEMCYYDANGIFIEKAVYFVQEVKCPDHLVKNDIYEVTFSDEDIKADRIKISKTVLNYPITEVHITKLGNGGVKLADAVFGVFDENDNLVAQITTDKSGVAIFKEAMLEKVYTYKELSAPEGYALNTDTFSFVAHTDGTVEGVLTVTDDQARVSISKVDTDTLESLAGAEFTIYDMDGNEVAKAISDEWGYADFVGLKWGLYEIRETDAPYGYDISGEVITVEITSNYVNADPILMKNSKTVQTGVEEQQEPLKDNLIKLAVLTLMVGLMLIALIIVPLATKPRRRY